MILRLYHTFLLLFLSEEALRDVRSGMISLWALSFAGGVGVLLRILFAQGIGSFLDGLEGAGIGLVLLLLAYASREAIGYGDALLVMASGMFLGWRENAVLLICATFLAAFAAALFLAFRRKKGKDRIPFAPFLLGGFVLLQLLN